MRKIIINSVFVLLLAGCCKTNSLEGTWELLEGEYVDKQGNMITYKEVGMKSLKMISGTHFSFTSMKGDEFWAGGTGTYQLQDGVYTESLTYNSFGEKPGTQFSFEYKLEGGHWTNSRWQDGKRVEFEIWRKLMEK
jgi:hypothetical protein